MKQHYFRAKSVETGEWIYGGYATKLDSVYASLHSPYIIDGDRKETFSETAVIRDTVGRCIMIMDIHDKLIFEDDIVEANFENPQGEPVMMRGVILYAKEYACYMFSLGDDDMVPLLTMMVDKRQMEIVGNIHELAN